MTSPPRPGCTRREWLAGGLGVAACLVPGGRLFADEPAREGWDSGRIESRASLDMPGTPWAVAFSPDGSLLASAGFEDNGQVGPSRVELWDTRNWARRPGFEIPDIRIHRLSFSPNGKTLVASGLDKSSLITCEVETGRCRTLVDNPETGGMQSPSVLSPDGSFLATSGPEGLMLWTVENWSKSQVLPGTREQSLTLAGLDAPEWRILGGWLYALDGAGLVYRMTSSGQRPPDVVVLPGFRYVGPPWSRLERIRGVARPWAAKHLTISPDGKLAAIAAVEEDGSGRIDLYEVDGGRSWRKRTSIKLAEGQFGNLYCLAFSPDGRALVGAGGTRTVWSWDVAKGGELPPLKEFQGAINALAFSKDGTMMAVADGQGRSIKVWSPRRAGRPR